MGKQPTHLRLRHKTWYARIAVPEDLRGCYGDRTMIDESMKTDSLSDAQIRRDLFLAKYRGEFKSRRQNQNLTEDDVARLRATLAHHKLGECGHGQDHDQPEEGAGRAA